jgi:hypothetical protein
MDRLEAEVRSKGLIMPLVRSRGCSRLAIGRPKMRFSVIATAPTGNSKGAGVPLQRTVAESRISSQRLE